MSCCRVSLRQPFEGSLSAWFSFVVNTHVQCVPMADQWDVQSQVVIVRAHFRQLGIPTWYVHSTDLFMALWLRENLNTGVVACTGWCGHVQRREHLREHGRPARQW